jgi:hypothetical protein
VQRRRGENTLKENFMNKQWKVVTLAFITAAALTVSVMGQDKPDKPDKPAPESNTSKATFENFGTDVDNYLDVHSYGDVEFDKWFGFGAYDTGLNLGLGYARKLGGIYLGAFYTGNVIQYIERDRNWNPDGEGKKTETITKTYSLVDSTV